MRENEWSSPLGGTGRAIASALPDAAQHGSATSGFRTAGASPQVLAPDDDLESTPPSAGGEPQPRMRNEVTARLPSEPDVDPNLAARAQAFAEANQAASTTKTYAKHWKQFAAWSAKRQLRPLPAQPETVALYLTHLASQSKKVSTIELALAAISKAHKLLGHPSPRADGRVRAVRAGIRRTLGTAQRHVRPVMNDDLRALIIALPDTIAGRRDRAILLIGFAAALRRSEICALDVEDFEVTPEGLLVAVRKSKTDQEQAGRTVGVPRGIHAETCPVAALERWLEASGIDTGAVFRGVDRHQNIRPNRLRPLAIAELVKRHVVKAGLDPARFSGHSLRAGLATSAAKAGKQERSIARQTGHKSLPTLRRYIRDGDVFNDNAAQGLF